MVLKWRSYISNLDHVKLSLGFFFLLGCIIENLLHKLSWYTFFCQKHTPKSIKFNVSPNFTSGNRSLVVPWSTIYVLFLEFFLFPSKGQPCWVYLFQVNFTIIHISKRFLKLPIFQRTKSFKVTNVPGWFHVCKFICLASFENL